MSNRPAPGEEVKKLQEENASLHLKLEELRKQLEHQGFQPSIISIQQQQNEPSVSEANPKATQGNKTDEEFEIWTLVDHSDGPDRSPRTSDISTSAHGSHHHPSSSKPGFESSSSSPCSASSFDPALEKLLLQASAFLPSDAKSTSASAEAEAEREGYVWVDDRSLHAALGEFVAVVIARSHRARSLPPEQLKALLTQSALRPSSSTYRSDAGMLNRMWSMGTFLYSVYGWSATAWAVYKEPALARLIASGLASAGKWVLVLFI